MKRYRKRSSAWFPWESLALLHCSFCQDNGCKIPSAGARTKGAEHRPLSHTNALCAVFIAGTGKHPAEQIFPFFCRCFGNTEKARATLLYSLFGESASIAFDWSRNARALPSATRRAEALHPLLTFFEKKVSQETLEQKGASIFEKQEAIIFSVCSVFFADLPSANKSETADYRLPARSLPQVAQK